MRVLLGCLLLALASPVHAKPKKAKEPAAEQDTPKEQACCRVCTKGCACGDSCISCGKTCHKGAGCACNAR
jgi:hypothetical protein